MVASIPFQSTASAPTHRRIPLSAYIQVLMECLNDENPCNAIEYGAANTPKLVARVRPHMQVQQSTVLPAGGIDACRLPKLAAAEARFSHIARCT